MSVAVYFGGAGERIRIVKGCLEGLGIRVDGAVLSGEVGERERQTLVLRPADAQTELFRRERLELGGRAEGNGWGRA